MMTKRPWLNALALGASLAAMVPLASQAADNHNRNGGGAVAHAL